MPHTLKVKGTREGRVIADGSEFIEVEFQILDGKKVVDTRKLGFPAGTPEKDIKAELQKAVDLYIAESEAAVADAEAEKVRAATKKTITSLNGFETDGKLPKKGR